MPELPECEAQRRLLERECLNRTIESVELGENVSYITLPGSNERARLVGRQFTQTRRHGKNIFAGSSTGPWLAVHLGMTGKLVAYDAPADPPDWTKLLISFEGSRRLAFRCRRKLGKAHVIDDPDEFIREQKLGPDALSIDQSEFAQVIGSTRSPIKAALMNQSRLAGIGNEMSDEILFQTALRPVATAADLGANKLGEIHAAMRRILESAVAAEGHESRLPQDWLIRHRKKGSDCPRCGGEIVSAKVGGRTAYFCAKHQV